MRHRRWRQLGATVMILLVLAAGGLAMKEISETMAASTRSGQVLAAFRADGAALYFSLLGHQGQLPYAAWGAYLWEGLTSLPAEARLLLWGGAAICRWGRDTLLPQLERIIRTAPS